MADYLKIAICVDCLFVLANGVETEADRLAAEGMAREWPDSELTINCPETCDGWFSWSGCEGCGSQLGGERHPAAVFPKRQTVT